ncbi:hypothetical protein EZE58_02515 [Brevibacterium sp. LS14]|uniref:DUF6907 domain-containing protein n=1 Tax=Brevibacterium sp. LS14 TaxID=2528962 RepID=UPI00142FE3B7|nr:hypothetical protein [Brevibacterium sp. LS14]
MTTYECKCGWTVTGNPEPDDIWDDDLDTQIDQHEVYCSAENMDAVEKAIRDNMPRHRAEHVLDLIRNENDPGADSAKKHTEVADPNTLQGEQIMIESIADYTAEEINDLIPHPLWCVKDCCIEHWPLSDVWHESRWQTKKFPSNPARPEQPLTASSRLVRYGVVNEEDSPAGLEIGVSSDEMVEQISIFLSPGTVRAFAQWLNDRADELDTITGKDGLS